MYVQLVNMILRLLLIAVLGDIINPDDGVVLLVPGVEDGILLRKVFDVG